MGRMVPRDALLSSQCSTRRTARAFFALALAITSSGSILAAPPTESAAPAPPPVETSESERHAVYGAGLRVGGAGMMGGLNALLIGFDLSYSPRPLFAVGLESELIGVDNGADPGYCIGCVRRGSSWRAFGEVRPFADFPVFPIARVSAGLYDVDITSTPRQKSQVGPTFGAAAGVEGRVSPLYLRLIAFATAQLGTETPARRSNHLAGFAIDLGAVF